MMVLQMVALELIVEDSAGNPQPALTRARKLMEQDGVHLLTGGLLSSTAYALQPYVDSQDPSVLEGLSALPLLLRAGTAS